MVGSLIPVLFLGFLLGVKHAVEPDHVIAVTTIASHSKKLSKATLAGIFWGVGHTLTLFAVGVGVILLKAEIPPIWSLSMEFLVGVLLVYFGMSNWLAFRIKKVHLHEHQHDGDAHRHFHSHQSQNAHAHPHTDGGYYGKSFCIGLVHGLAGSAALLLLTVSSVDTVAQGVLYMLLFGAGTMTGMLLCSTALALPFVWSQQEMKLNRFFIRFVGAVSALYGVYYMVDVLMIQGLVGLWLS